MSKLVDLLKNLGSDAELAAAYERNPESVLDRFDLAAEERQALLDGDVDRIKSLSGLSDVHMTNSTIKSYD